MSNKVEKKGGDVDNPENFDGFVPKIAEKTKKVKRW